MARASGILLHITSLPSAFGIGDFGSESYRFVELLCEACQSYWSILPLSPIRLEDGNSPYQTSSAFAGNTLLVSPEKLVESELLPNEYLKKTSKPTSKVNYKQVYAQKEELLKKAYATFKKLRTKNFELFCSEQRKWLNDYALYAALRKKTNEPWHSWPNAVRKREPQAIAKKEIEFADEIEYEKFKQYVFFSQFFTLKDFCRAKHVSIIGDIPFYMTYDSADVWAHQELFSLNSKGKPKFVGGVPPDYFSSSGQLWGNPVYNWQKMKETSFEWWIDRITHSLKVYDKLRLDHFRGLIAYWQVSASALTAKKGRWIKTPSEAFFKAVKTALPSLPFIAEDLGYIDESVRRAIARLGIPGMRVLLFAFDGSPMNPHLPKNHIMNSVVFTGTHDTNTVKGWFVDEATGKEKRNLFKVLGDKVSDRQVSHELIKMALSSVADLSIIPLQDALSLGSRARMNNPSQPAHNWEWRATPKQLARETLSELKRVTLECHRAND